MYKKESRVDVLLVFLNWMNEQQDAFGLTLIIWTNQDAENSSENIRQFIEY